MRRPTALFACLPVSLTLACTAALAQTTQDRYYAHRAVEDSHGVIAPWYEGQNGQWDYRVRVAADTLKRYPWALPPRAAMPAPEFVYNGSWSITDEGAITVPPPSNQWDNGDVGQRGACVIWALRNHYAYSGDPSAITLLSVYADYLVKHCQTPADHPWPRFLVSCPTKGDFYGDADPHGFIQLDMVAWVGFELVKAYEMTGNEEWLATAMHWADVLAEKRSREPGAAPWQRYANPEDVPWGEEAGWQTGGVVFLVQLFDELIRLGHTGADGAYVESREAGVRYLRDVLMPEWTRNDVFGMHYWDWENPCGTGGLTETVATYMMEHPRDFPNWRNDARNALVLHLNHTSVSPASNSDVFSGAWAYPESAHCCWRSLWYGPLWMAKAFGLYGELTGDEWAREIARRTAILSTYDCRPTGVVEDNIDGGAIAAGTWFNLAHPCALLAVLENMRWRPELYGAARESHLIHASSVVRHIVYGKGRIAYETFDAPAGEHDTLRLSCTPTRVTADGRRLPRLGGLHRNGFTVEPLDCGDRIVRIRHDGRTRIAIEGEDPQTEVDDASLDYTGRWGVSVDVKDRSGGVHVASEAGASVDIPFTGNQVRVIGRTGPTGGRADVYLDGEKQLAIVDAHSPRTMHRQVLYSASGLAQGPHTLRLAATGEGNPLSLGADVAIDAVQWSAEKGRSGFGEGGGPTGTQRVALGYTGRQDYVDSEGNAWRPGAEFIVRLEHLADSVTRSWWTKPRCDRVAGARDPELYRRGVHGKDFTLYFTVGPGVYHVRIKLAETREVPAEERAMAILVNGREAFRNLDIAATARGYRRAADLVVNNVHPVHGVIAVRFVGCYGSEAIAQAVEIGPGDGGRGARPVSVRLAPGNLLRNPGFEQGAPGRDLSPGQSFAAWEWTYENVGEVTAWFQPESYYGREWTQLGEPVFASGEQALRTHGEPGVTTRIWQESAVLPGATYEASARVAPASLEGRGFGAGAEDEARIVVEELSADGDIVATHESDPITEAGAYGEFAPLRASFTTRADAARVRFTLTAHQTVGWEHSHVTFDDCALVGPRP